MEFDDNGDGKFESIQFYNDQEKLIRLEIDQNGDGGVDRWSYFKNNRLRNALRSAWTLRDWGVFVVVFFHFFN